VQFNTYFDHRFFSLMKTSSLQEYTDGRIPLHGWRIAYLFVEGGLFHDPLWVTA